MMSIEYRSDIDGLRALSVLSIILYHLNFDVQGVRFLPGGYLGVDIFFVISGFLITSIIIKEIQQSTFSFKRFYIRRARRLLPALATVIFTTMPLAWWLLPSNDLLDYAYSVLSGLYFYSNFYFFWEDPYFAASSVFSPLLHNWSLAVEEQFYLIIPALLVMLLKSSLRLCLSMTIAILVASFLLANWISLTNPDAAFYLLPFRIWELMTGVVLALLLCNRDFVIQEKYAALTSGVGLGLILWALLYFEQSTRHPSSMTAIPIIGAVLIILANHDKGFPGKLFSNRIALYLGKISYSLYLWHFPLIAFALHYFTELDAAIRGGIFIATFVLASATYHSVESYFRYRSKTFTFALAMVSSFFLISAAAVTLITNHKELTRYRMGNLDGLFDDIQDVSVPRLPCRDGTAETVFSVCNSAEKEAGVASHKRIVLVGDSHAEPFAQRLKKYSDDNGYTFFAPTIAGCKFIEGATRNFEQLKGGTFCHKYGKYWPKELNDWLRATSNDFQYTTIIWSTRLMSMLEGPYVNRDGEREKWRFENKKVVAMPGYTGSFEHLFEKQMQLFQEHSEKLILVYPVPELGWKFSKLIEQNRDKSADAIFDDLTSKYSLYSYYQQRSQWTFNLLNKVQGVSVKRVYPHKDLCNVKTDICTGLYEGKLLYKDDDHLGKYGVDLLWSQFIDALN